MIIKYKIDILALTMTTPFGFTMTTSFSAEMMDYDAESTIHNAENIAPSTPQKQGDPMECPWAPVKKPRQPQTKLPKGGNLGELIEWFFPIYNKAEQNQRWLTEIYKNAELHIGEKVGNGANGSVYKMVGNGANGTRHHYAIKIADSDNSSITREINILKKLPPHENVVFSVDSGVNGNKSFIVTELFDMDLYTYIINTPQIPSHAFMQILMGISKGLAHLHTQGFIHGDIKPENIMLKCDESGNILNVVIIDMAGRFVYEITPISTTISISPPEVPLHKALTQAVDIWALGCIIYMLIWGTCPFYDPSREGNIQNMVYPEWINHYDKTRGTPSPTTLFPRTPIGDGHRRPITAYASKIDNPLKMYDILNRCFQIHPSLRPTSSEVLHLLNEIK